MGEGVANSLPVRLTPSLASSRPPTTTTAAAAVLLQPRASYPPPKRRRQADPKFQTDSTLSTLKS